MIWLLVLGCSDQTAEQRLSVLDALARGGALAWYQEFEVRAADLSRASEVHCAAGGELEPAREAWWAAREPWRLATLVHFGPTVEYPLRLGPKLDDQPVLEEAVEEAIAATAAPNQAAFDAMGSATRGLPVVEYLLWGAPLDDTRCAYLVGASADVALNAATLASSWESDWLPLIAAPDPEAGADWDTPQDALDEWVNRMIFTVENLRVEDLGEPNGDKSGGEPHPELVKSRYSDRSLQDARDALAGVQAAWEGPDGLDLRPVGSGEDTERLGVRDLVPEEDAALVERIDGLFATSAARLEEVPEPLSDTVLVEPELVARAQEALLALQVALQVELAQSLGVTVAFNDNDGD